MATAGGMSPLECGVCMETYSRTEHIPKSLPCGHSFCKICLENIVSAGCIPCPVCKQKCSVPREGVQGLVTNYPILDMSDLTCSQCQKFGQTSSCLHCPLNMCTTCLDDHVQSEFCASVQQNLQQVLHMKNEQQPKFNAFVCQMNTFYQNVDDFHDKASEVMKVGVNQDILKELDKTSSQFTAAMNGVKDLLTRCQISVDPDQPCFMLLESTSTYLTPSEFKLSESSQKYVESTRKKFDASSNNVESSSEKGESSSKKGESSSKNGESSRKTQVPKTESLSASHRQSDTYTIEPHLVTGSEGSGPGQLHSPQGAAADVHSGDVYVADYRNSRICVYGADYAYQSAFDVGSLPWDLCLTTDGDVAVICDDHTARIYSKSGTLKQTIGKKGKKKGKFDDPQGIVSDSDGHLYICDWNNHRVQVMDKSGAVVRVLGTSGRGKLEYPRSAAVHPLTRQVYVTDGGKQQVNIYSRHGQYETCIEKADIHRSNFWPLRVSFRDDGLLCISDGYNDCMHLMRDGRVIQTIGERGSAPGQFYYPQGTFSGAGDLIVCDNNNHRIQIFCTN